MTRDQQRLEDYLDHILEAIDRILRYSSGLDLVEFLDNELVQDAVLRNLEVIGEAARNVLKEHPQFAENNAALPLRYAYEMRNALAHGYFAVDLEIVWATIERDLPEFKAKLIERRREPG